MEMDPSGRNRNDARWGRSWIRSGAAAAVPTTVGPRSGNRTPRLRLRCRSLRPTTRSISNVAPGGRSSASPPVFPTRVRCCRSYELIAEGVGLSSGSSWFRIHLPTSVRSKTRFQYSPVGSAVGSSCSRRKNHAPSPRLAGKKDIEDGNNDTNKPHTDASNVPLLL